MSRHRRPPIAKTVWVEVDGKRYEGSYVIEKRLITVSVMMVGSITTQLGGSPRSSGPARNDDPARAHRSTRAAQRAS